MMFLCTKMSLRYLQASATTTEVKTVVTTTRSSKVVKAAQDEFDTGSESESEINKSNYSLTSRGNSDFKKGMFFYLCVLF